MTSKSKAKLAIVFLAVIIAGVLASACPTDGGPLVLRVVLADGSDPMPLCRGKGCK